MSASPLTNKVSNLIPVRSRSNLRAALNICHRLRIEVHRDAAVGMPEQLLHRLHVFSCDFMIVAKE